MLLAEDPATLIRHTIDNFNIGPDKSAVERVDESLSTLRQARDLRLREASSSLQRLARQLSTISQRHEELLAAQTTGAHAAASDHAALDSEKFRTAKAASDAEAEAEKAALKAADLAARLQELDLQGVEGDVGAATAARRDYVDDEVLLRLKVYRSLGIDLERDGDGDSGGEWTRAVIRNDRKGDVHVVNIEKKFSRFFYANYFWKTL